MSHTYKNIAILGLGLIGSSVARAVRHYGVAERIRAFDSNPLVLQLGAEQGFIDHAADSIGDALSGADLVVIAMPPTAALEAMDEVAAHLMPGALLTDALSVKLAISQACKEKLAGQAAYVPAHPIAGSEKSGAGAGRADLFAGKRVILTPETPDDAGIQDIAAFWSDLGAVVEYMPPDVHDLVYAYVSHLPQLLAFGFAEHAAPLAGNPDLPEHFTRFTRLCASDRRLWDDIFAQNKLELDAALARFLALLTHIRRELAEADEEDLAEEPASELTIWAHWVPRLVASCLIATIAQQSKDTGFNFHHFVGSGFIDFTAPLVGDPDEDMEAIAQHAAQVGGAIDKLLTSLLKFVSV